ncbi:MAG: hydrolase, partial [Gammaproteobacteria bacterium]|nr:hydrolase [Gammaproteobacteria bacterium]
MISGSTFKPAWWLLNRHAQTIWPTLFRKRFKQDFQRIRFELPDGDFVDVDWTLDNGGPLVIILHGLEGNIHSHYATSMLQHLAQSGFTAGLLYFRGCSGEANRLPRAYHSGDTADVAFVVNQIKQQYPERKCFAVGFSLGGNVLLKWLGETGSANPLNAAVAVSVPFELARASQQLNEGFSKIYQKHLLDKLLRSLARKRDMTTPFDIEHALESKTIYEFDERVTAPVHGFTDAMDYYEKSSCRQFLSTISIPTLIIHAEDDPFMTPDVIPGEHELSPGTRLELSKQGGHMGFVSGPVPFRPIYWLEQRIS